MLIGESTGKEVRNSIFQLAQQVGAFEHVNEVLAMYMGPDYILVSLGVDLTDSLQVVSQKEPLWILTEVRF